MKPVFINGACVYDTPSVMEIADYCRREKETLWDETKRLVYPHRVYVDLSEKLYTVKKDLLNQMSLKGDKGDYHMKIIVLAGGLSTERDVPLLFRRRHLPYIKRKRTRCVPFRRIFRSRIRFRQIGRSIYFRNSGLEIAEGIKTTEPDLEAVEGIAFRPITVLIRTKRYRTLPYGRHCI